MTDKQCHIAILLLKGGSVSGTDKYGYKVFDDKRNSVAKFTTQTWYHVRKLCRQDKQSGRIVIDKRKVRALHGSSLIKKHYKKLLLQQKQKRVNKTIK